MSLISVLRTVSSPNVNMLLMQYIHGRLNVSDGFLAFENDVCVEVNLLIDLSLLLLLLSVRILHQRGRLASSLRCVGIECTTQSHKPGHTRHGAAGRTLAAMGSA
jgi:hypothetical protein